VDSHRIIALVTGLIGIGAIIPFSGTQRHTTVTCDVPETAWGVPGVPLEEALAWCEVRLETVETMSQVYGGVYAEDRTGTTVTGSGAEIVSALRAGGPEGMPEGQGAVCLRVLGTAAEMQMSVTRAPDRPGHWRITCALEG